MRRTRFDHDECPIARTTDLLGDWWTPLVVRELLDGPKRFDELATDLQIPRATLASRLERLENEGVLTAAQYRAHPPRREYRLTRKGAALSPVVDAMRVYGDAWLPRAPGGPDPDLPAATTPGDVECTTPGATHDPTV